MKFSSYRLGRLQQGAALLLFYSFIAVVLADFVKIEVTAAVPIALIAALVLIILSMSLNVCEHCGTCIFKHHNRYPIDFSNTDGFVSPVRECTNCKAPVRGAKS